jgi:hypothetical protein
MRRTGVRRSGLCWRDRRWEVLFGPIAIDKLLKAGGIGFPWTMRIVGFIMVPCFGFACLVAKEPPTVADKVGERKEEDVADGTTPVKQVDRRVEALALFK